MVLRTFVAIDSDNLVVTSSSDAGLVGNGIINNSSTPDGTVFTYSSGGGTTVTIDDTDTYSDNIPDDNNLFFNDDDPGDHTVVDGGGIVNNGNGVEAESTIILRALDGDGNQTGPQIEVTVFSQNGVTGNVWGFATDTQLVDGTSYVKISGDNDGTVPYSDFITCFESATMIKTWCGVKKAKDIAVGDMVLTRDHGYQAVRWIGKRQLTEMELQSNPKLCPVRIMQGSFGNGLPKRDLVVSRQHRMLVQSKIAERMFGSSEVLIPAIKLTELPGIFVDETFESLGYVHLLFDQHEIIYAEGAATESLFTGSRALRALSAEARNEILTIFPEIAKQDHVPQPARRVPPGKLQKRLLDRHRRNEKPLVSEISRV